MGAIREQKKNHLSRKGQTDGSGGTKPSENNRSTTSRKSNMIRVEPGTPSHTMTTGMRETKNRFLATLSEETFSAQFGFTVSQKTKRGKVMIAKVLVWSKERETGRSAIRSGTRIYPLGRGTNPQISQKRVNAPNALQIIKGKDTMNINKLSEKCSSSQSTLE